MKLNDAERGLLEIGLLFGFASGIYFMFLVSWLISLL